MKIWSYLIGNYKLRQAGHSWREWLKVYGASVAAVIKVTPQSVGLPVKSLVNIYTYENVHFEDQAIAFKKLYYKYKAKCLVIDANGLGIGLVDYMVKSQVDPETGDSYPDFGVAGGNFKGWDEEYRKFRTDRTEGNAMYLVKASAPLDTEAHTYLQSQLNANKLSFLIDEKIAKQKLLSTVKGKNMTPEERKEYLMPYTLTGVLKEELLNLVEETDGANVRLRQGNKMIPKDKFSAFEYGLYYIKLEEENIGKRRKKRFNAADWGKLFN